MAIQLSTIQLLRFHFSFFLMPVYWLAIALVPDLAIHDAILVFIILHLLVYPSSNGYNSYMDRDTESIGGLKNPRQPTKQLFYATIVLDIMALLLSICISFYFFAGIFLYIAASRAYSYRGIRLKKYPLAGYLTVIVCQGALTFFLVMHGSSTSKFISVPLIGMIGAALLVGGFYPLTQIYQHQQDKADGVITLSYKLGYNGTFIFTAIIYFLAMCAIGFFMYSLHLFSQFLVIQLISAPILLYFFWWFRQVYHDPVKADFKNTMRMNIIASLFTNAAFIYLFITQKL